MDQETRRELVKAKDTAASGRFRDGLAKIELLVSQFPDDEEIAYERASMISVYSPAGFALKAAKDFSTQFPQFPSGPLLVGHVLISMKRGREALAEIEKAEALGAPPDQVRNYRIHALTVAGRKTDALRLAEAGSGLGNLMLRDLLEPPKSEADLDEALRALEAAGQSQEILIKLRGDWYVEHGLFDKASDCLHKGLEVDESSFLLNDLMAFVELKKGNRVAALQRYERILERDPDNFHARSSAVSISLQTGRIFSALRHFRVGFASTKSLHGPRWLNGGK